MESAQSKYTEKRLDDVPVPVHEGLTKEETMATRGMSLQWATDQTVVQDTPPLDTWNTLGKRKQTPKTGHKKK
jgi:hypothetical protein